MTVEELAKGLLLFVQLWRDASITLPFEDNLDDEQPQASYPEVSL